MEYQVEPTFAAQMDAQDPLQTYRQHFHIPQQQGRDTIYFCGNSLGLQPKAVATEMERELTRWRTLGVEGHFAGDQPWVHYHKYLQPASARIVGAQETEVVVMNTLTVNLHLLLVSFYRPTAQRYKIVMEAAAFPSDQYAIASQVKFHGFDPAEAIVEVAPRSGEEILRTEDILHTIERHGDSVALVLFGGVNYYTGQFFDLAAITATGHDVGAMVGFDLAHAAGNVELHLHDWQVDFAAWCSYKYLNSGPGGPSGIFVHERHGQNSDLPRFAGWWGHDEANRFLMKKEFQPMPGAAGWQLSCGQILSFAPHKASLALFDQVDMPTLRAKSEQLTNYLLFLLREMIGAATDFRIITPNDPAARGCQLSIYFSKQGQQIYNYLKAHGVICDWREDNLSADAAQTGGVIRVAPTPMYNTFTEVWEFVSLMQKALEQKT